MKATGAPARVLAGVSLATAATAAVAGVLFGLQGLLSGSHECGDGQRSPRHGPHRCGSRLGSATHGGSRGTEMTITAHHTSQMLLSDRHGASATRADAAMTDLLGRDGSAAGLCSDGYEFPY
jgi:hypothetical protein